MTSLAIIGTENVGLVTGTCFSHLGDSVTCCDSNLVNIGVLNNGHVRSVADVRHILNCEMPIEARFTYGGVGC
jgi:UDP-glucose 6-dehydrogenase